MKRRFLQIWMILFFLTPVLIPGQRPQGNPRGIISGQVFDSINSSKLEYANIVLFKTSDSSFVSGATTNANGKFIINEIPPGQFFLDIKFIGYKVNRIADLRIGRRQLRVELGKIYLERTVIAAQTVEVIGDRPMIEYKIDKKVVNVSENYAHIAGTAVDVLENVPSLSVDLEGNVSLRGSSSFTVLIDNRPTALDANDVLQQIPASTIDNIEIITNPSARYDPEGISGIINVITKKRRLEGVSGMINTNGGLDDKYGADFLLNFRNGFGNISLGGNYSQRTRPGQTESENRTIFNDTTSTINSTGSTDSQRRRMGLNGEIQLFLSQQDNLNLGFRIGDFRMERTSELDFREVWSPGTINNNYLSYSDSERGGEMQMVAVDYQHIYASKAELSMRMMYFHRAGDEESSNRLMTADQTVKSGQLTTEKGPSDRLRGAIHYQQPFARGSKFEAGYQGHERHSTDITGFSQYDSVTADFIYLPEFSHNIDYRRAIHSIYSLFSQDKNRLGYQIGIRSEFTDRTVTVSGGDSSTPIKRWDYFPTLHGSWKMTDKIQIMSSYSRRINRPRGYYLEPFLTWTDAYNVRKGNSNLKPEYINSYELGIQLPFSNNLISVEVYLRERQNLIERTRQIYAANVTLHSVENVGQSQSTGLELMFNIKEIKWWDINLIGNIYVYQVEGEFAGNSYNHSSDNWSLRLNNIFRFGDATRIQLTGRYNSPSASSQGTRAGYYVTNLGIRRNLLGRNLSLTLQINDIFSSAIREYTAEGDNFYAYSRNTRDAPTAMLTISYNFNNFKQQRRNRGEEGEDFEEDF